MSSELQDIVDSLGQRLQRAVAIDDPRMRLQAYSPHYGAVDGVRLASILRREADPLTATYVLGLGIADATGPVRIAGQPDRELLPRVCVPIRHRDLQIGFLWLIDADQSLTPEQLELAVAAAEAAGVVMYRERLLAELERGRERELLRDLLSGDEELRVHAAAGLVDAELFQPGTHVLSLVVRPVHGERQSDQRVQQAIDVGLTVARRFLPQRQLLHLGRFDHGVVVAAVSAELRTDERQDELGRHVRDVVTRHLYDVDPGYRVLVGIGEVQPALVQAAASYRQGQQATKVAEVVGSLGDVVRWRDLGVYRMLAHIAVEELTREVLHPGLVRLLAEDTQGGLIRTLECFLDNAGDVKATSAALLIHRTSLYYRLSKVEQLAGIRLSSGDDRLAMHLGLKTARLVGLF